MGKKVEEYSREIWWNIVGFFWPNLDVASYEYFKPTSIDETELTEHILVGLEKREKRKRKNEWMNSKKKSRNME